MNREMGYFLKEGGIARYCSELVSCGDHRVLNCYNLKGSGSNGVDSLFSLFRLS